MNLTDRIIRLVKENPSGLTKREISESLGAYPVSVNSAVQRLMLQRRLERGSPRPGVDPRAYVYVPGPNADERWEHGRWTR